MDMDWKFNLKLIYDIVRCVSIFSYLISGKLAKKIYKNVFDLQSITFNK